MINVRAHNIRKEIQLLQHFIDGDRVEFADVDLLIYWMWGNFDDILRTVDGAIVEWMGRRLWLAADVAGGTWDQSAGLDNIHLDRMR
jgi:hypothetical protein